VVLKEDAALDAVLMGLLQDYISYAEEIMKTDSDA